MPDPEAALLEARQLACRRGGRLLFAELSFVLQAGEALVLRGPNGSGKSSLLRILAGLMLPATGTLRWRGEPVADDPAAYHAATHYVAHADGLKTALTAAENLAFAAGLGGHRGDPVTALAAFDLAGQADLAMRYFSTGQRRRTALARLLVVARPLWLLDEPGVGLDTANRARLEALIAGHRRHGGIAVIATHGDVTVSPALVLDLPG